jgi:serine/threonine protein kinase
MLGQRLTHYEILEKIGAGGMGEVYRARDSKLGREVALKVLPQEFSSDPERLRRFQNEARAVASLNHPNIVTIHSVEEADGVHFLTMELVKGLPLGDIIPPRGFPLDRFLALALPLTDGLSSAHEVGIVHRDLKPSNVMVGEENRVKILDFGLAVFVQGKQPRDQSEASTKSQITGEGVVVGTFSYMSPEQLEKKTVDTRSDIFSLGIILYQMVTGLRPFQGDSMAAVMSSILKDTPTPAASLRGDLPIDLGRIITRCLEKDPKRRFQTVRDVHNELQDICSASAASSGAHVVSFPPSGEIRPVSGPVAVEPVSGEAGFKHDLYISYAHLDNEAQLAGQEGWISAFHRSLEVRVGQLLGKKPVIFRDPKSHGDDTFDESQLEHVPISALLITVLSPRYIKSEWCNRELQEFLRAASRTGGPKWGSRYRVFKVIKTPTPLERHPSEIQPLLSYEFYMTDRETGRPRELDQIFGPEAQREYWARLDDLAHDIAELLERAEPAAGDDSSPSARSGGLVSPGTRTATDQEGSWPSGSKGLIYLAQTTHDLKEEHDALRRDLHGHGYWIVPDRPLPLVEDELRSYVRETLDRCKMSVHLVGQNYGLVPEGATDSLIALQNEVAVERATSGAFNRLIWLPPNLEIADERQKSFVDQIRNDPRMQRNCDLLETPLEDLKTFVHQILSPPRRVAEPRPQAPARGDGVKHVYLICDQRDLDDVSPLADALFERGFEVITPVFEGDEAEVREDHEENLRLCDAVLLYYGAGNELWLRRKLREVQKSAGMGRMQPIRAKGIWVAPPATAQKQRLRTREAVIMNQPEEFSPGLLGPFVSTIGAK